MSELRANEEECDSLGLSTVPSIDQQWSLACDLSRTPSVGAGGDFVPSPSECKRGPRINGYKLLSSTLYSEPLKRGTNVRLECLNLDPNLQGSGLRRSVADYHKGAVLLYKGVARCRCQPKTRGEKSRGPTHIQQNIKIT